MGRHFHFVKPELRIDSTPGTIAAANSCDECKNCGDCDDYSSCEQCILNERIDLLDDLEEWDENYKTHNHEVHHTPRYSPNKYQVDSVALAATVGELSDDDVNFIIWCKIYGLKYRDAVQPLLHHELVPAPAPVSYNADDINRILLPLPPFQQMQVVGYNGFPTAEDDFSDFDKLRGVLTTTTQSLALAEYDQRIQLLREQSATMTTDAHRTSRILPTAVFNLAASYLHP